MFSCISPNGGNKDKEEDEEDKRDGHVALIVFLLSCTVFCDSPVSTMCFLLSVFVEFPTFALYLLSIFQIKRCYFWCCLSIIIYFD